MTSLNTLSITETQKGLREKKFSVRELVSDCIKEIEHTNTAVRAYLSLSERVLEDAQKADELLRDTAPHTLPPLFGIPLAIKDNIVIEGAPCTAGSKILAEYRAPYDATVITKLKKHGALFLGKTNLDEFAMGSSTENSAFGPTKNPRDLTRVPGGSSGGSAAAVAGNMCIGALGSDTGGSIRQPASFCGIVGLKTTYGSVSRHGLIAMASSLDQIGPMTKTVEDARILFDAIKGEDNFDATALKKSYQEQNTPHQTLKKIRVGIPKEYFSSGLDPHVAHIIQSVIKKIEDAGAEVKEISLPHSQYALPTYYIIVPSEVSSNLARFDGIRYGHHAHEANSLSEVYTHSRAEGFGPEVKRRIMLGTYALSAGYYDAYYLKAQKVRRLIREDFAKAFETVDVMLGPTTPTPAFAFGEKTDDPLQMYLADIYTVAVNLAGVPALSLPAGTVDGNGTQLPVGLQIIGKWFEESHLLDVATHIETLIAS